MPDITPHKPTQDFFAVMREIVSSPEPPTLEKLRSARELFKSIVDEFLAIPNGDLYSGEDHTHFFAALPPGFQRDLLSTTLSSANNSLRSFARVVYAIRRPDEVSSEDPLIKLVSVLGKILGDSFPPPPDEKK